MLRHGHETVVVPGELQVGDLMLVKPGERLATDGVIALGRTALDISAITGESMPIEAGPGDEVFAGSINGTGALTVTVTTTAEDNSLARIVHIVETEQSRKGASQRLADRIARPLVPGVMIAAALIALIGTLAGDPVLWIERALVVLVADHEKFGGSAAVRLVDFSSIDVIITDAVPTGDIDARLRAAGVEVVVCPGAS